MTIEDRWNIFISELKAYIVDILTRFMNGEDADESFLTNHYTPLWSVSKK